jgi:uncharacterized protein
MRIALALLLLFGASVQAAEPQHVLWSVKGKANTVYLLGSMHFLPSSEQLPAAMLDAYRESEKLVMEIDMDDLDPSEVQMLTLQLGMLPPDQSLEQELGSKVFERLSTQARDLGLDPAMLQRMRPWLAGLTLTQLALMKLGWDPQAGVEQQFVRLAERDKKEIIGLETFAAQMQLLASLSPELQRQFVLYSVDDADTAAREIDELTRAWRAGDLKGLQELLDAGFRKYPKLYEPLTVVRNRAWMSSIEPLLQRGDDYLIVVGAAHLVGPDSVVDLLQRAGFKITRH